LDYLHIGTANILGIKNHDISLKKKQIGALRYSFTSLTMIAFCASPAMLISNM
jgi:hypothetical protein